MTSRNAAGLTRQNSNSHEGLEPVSHDCRTVGRDYWVEDEAREGTHKGDAGPDSDTRALKLEVEIPLDEDALSTAMFIEYFLPEGRQAHDPGATRWKRN